MPRTESRSQTFIDLLTRSTPVLTSVHTSAPPGFAGQLWAGLIRSTPAFTAGRSAETHTGSDERDTASGFRPRSRTDSRRIQAILTATLGDPARAEEFSRDARPCIALLLMLSPQLGLDAARAKATRLIEDVNSLWARTREVKRALRRALPPGGEESFRDLYGAVSLTSQLADEFKNARAAANLLNKILIRDGDKERDIDLARGVAGNLLRNIDLGLQTAGALEHTQFEFGNARWLNMDLETFIRELRVVLTRSEDLYGGLMLDISFADLRGADLTNARLSGANLRGVLWSVSTRWPRSELGAIQARSREIEPGTFRIDGDMRHNAVLGV